jgi:hypothetical protein
MNDAPVIATGRNKRKLVKTDLKNYNSTKGTTEKHLIIILI